MMRILSIASVLILLSTEIAAGAQSVRPNIVWIVGEDASAHLGCYGETTIRTPHLDRLASEGVRFTNAFTTSPVCSPSRSAMVTGMFPPSIGAHNHRSQQMVLKASGNSAYYKSYELPDEVPFVPALFKQAGYFTTLGQGPGCDELGKTDYNFLFNPSVYHAADWRVCPVDQPFFAQIMLKGGKARRESKIHGTNPADVSLPPYYPDHPVLRKHWAEYLNTWVRMDEEVGQILSDLDEAGVAENTIVFFWTDHGLTHIRAKQFLYDEGIHIPLIVRFGDGRRAGTVRDDLVQHIDIAAASLAIADVGVHSSMHGRDFFAADYMPRERIFSARDRCDETVDMIRCVRTKRYKYIRNFMSYMSHTQPNESKDHQPTFIATKILFESGELNEAQSMAFTTTRKPEELYDLESDPFETTNLAQQPQYSTELRRLRQELYNHMVERGDLGLVPEPILEELGRDHDNKAFVVRSSDNRELIQRLIELMDAGQAGNVDKLAAQIDSESACDRYWAATWLGLCGGPEVVDALERKLNDEQPAVRIGAALALHRLGVPRGSTRVLIEETRNYNPLVGLYALRALEIANLDDVSVRKTFAAAQNHPYEFARRIANRALQQD